MRDVSFNAVQIGLNDRAHGGIPRSNALDEVNGALRIKRPFHVDAQKIIEARSTLHDGAKQAFAKFDVDVEAELRELSGNVGVQPFLSDAFKNLEIGIAGMLRIGNGGNIFAEVIEAGVHARVIALPGVGGSFTHRFATAQSAPPAPPASLRTDPIATTLPLSKLHPWRPTHPA